MKRRQLLACLLCTLTLTMLTACGHTHTASGGWNSDLENHWHICAECKETFDSAAHALEDEVCTVCGSEVVTYESGEKQLVVYNDQGDATLFVVYGADGSVVAEDRYEYTYDADGNKRTEVYYNGETLSAEYEYKQSSSGETYLARDTSYFEDGSSSVNEYDEHGNILYFANMDPEGNVWDAAEYTYNDDGTWMGEKNYLDGVLAAEREYAVIDPDMGYQLVKEITYNEDGSWMGAEYDRYENQVIELHTNADGTVELDRRFEHTYDADGNKTLTKTYDNGVLVEEMEFWFGSDEEGSWSMSGKTTTYHEDGSKTVSDSDPEATWSSETTYDAAGNVVEEIRYEYLKDENGEDVGSRGYKNGELFVETEFITGPDGEDCILWTEYNEDGTKTVTELDETLETVKITVYDADGTVISEEEPQ